MDGHPYVIDDYFGQKGILSILTILIIHDDKMKKIVKEKTGYVFSEKELRELDFSIYNKYRTKY